MKRTFLGWFILIIQYILATLFIIFFIHAIGEITITPDSIHAQNSVWYIIFLELLIMLAIPSSKIKDTSGLLTALIISLSALPVFCITAIILLFLILAIPIPIGACIQLTLILIVMVPIIYILLARKTIAHILDKEKDTLQSNISK